MKRFGAKLRTKPRNASADPLVGDLSNLLTTGLWQEARFELTKPKRKTITLRISEELLRELKKHATMLGLDYQRFIRLALERSLLHSTI